VITRVTLMQGFRVLFKCTHPRPTARMCERTSEGRKTLRNSAEKIPPFFITLVFLMLSVLERFGCLSRNSLQRQNLTLV